MPARSIPITTVDDDKVVIYSDASTQPFGLRIGILVITSDGRHLCTVADVPNWVVDQWKFRKTYIGQGELMAGPIALHVFS